MERKVGRMIEVVNKVNGLKNKKKKVEDFNVSKVLVINLSRHPL